MCFAAVHCVQSCRRRLHTKTRPTRQPYLIQGCSPPKGWFLCTWFCYDAIPTQLRNARSCILHNVNHINTHTHIHSERIPSRTGCLHASRQSSIIWYRHGSSAASIRTKLLYGCEAVAAKLWLLCLYAEKACIACRESIKRME